MAVPNPPRTWSGVRLLPFKTFITATLVWVLMLGTTRPVQGVPLISASAAVLMDQKTGQVLFAKNPDWQRPPASTTKIMTAVLTLQMADLRDEVLISQRAARTPGSSMYLRPGQRYRVRDLLYGLMLCSGNDAAVALAEHIAGNEEEFVSLMNRQAALLGAAHTTFANPHGLPAPGHCSTALDLARITRYALGIPRFAQLVSTVQTTVFDPVERKEYKIHNKNRLLWEFAGADGVKTGYTRAAGRCLVASATRHGRQVIAVVLDAPRMWEDTRKLLTYGLEEYENIQLASKTQTLGSVPVRKGLLPFIGLVPATDVWVTARRGEAAKWKTTWEVRPELLAPLQQWEPVGRLRVKFVDSIVKEVPLLANQAVPAKDVWQSLRRLLQPVWQLLPSR